MYVDLDAGPGRAKTGNGCANAPVEWLFAVGEIAGVVAGAVEAAVAEQVWVGEVGAELFGGAKEVIDRAGLVG